jgi:hypothetical protein
VACEQPDNGHYQQEDDVASQSELSCPDQPPTCCPRLPAGPRLPVRTGHPLALHRAAGLVSDATGFPVCAALWLWRL